jgi:hypothetical protein
MLVDLYGRLVTIERGLLAGELATPKSGQARTLAVGASTAQLRQHLDELDRASRGSARPVVVQF